MLMKNLDGRKIACETYRKVPPETRRRICVYWWAIHLDIEDEDFYVDSLFWRFSSFPNDLLKKKDANEN